MFICVSRGIKFLGRAMTSGLQNAFEECIQSSLRNVIGATGLICLNWFVWGLHLRVFRCRTKNICIEVEQTREARYAITLNLLTQIKTSSTGCMNMNEQNVIETWSRFILFYKWECYLVLLNIIFHLFLVHWWEYKHWI